MQKNIFHQYKPHTMRPQNQNTDPLDIEYMPFLNPNRSPRRTMSTMLIPNWKIFQEDKGYRRSLFGRNMSQRDNLCRILILLLSMFPLHTQDNYLLLYWNNNRLGRFDNQTHLQMRLSL